MEQKYKYMVCTRCFTFNQAQFIVDAMNGFIMQETTFPVVTLIVDDASSDGEPEVINQYLKDYFLNPYREEETDDYCMICAKHKTNINCDFVVILLKYNHYSVKKSKLSYLSEWLDNSKYHALCEGDDFWVNPNKLQMQVDFMEANPDYSMCHGDVIYYNSDTKTSIGRRGKQTDYKKQKPYKTREEIFNRIIRGDYGAIYLTYLIRKECSDRRKPNEVPLMMGDLPFLLDMSQEGMIKYFPDVFGVYRIHQGSISRQNPERNRRFRLAGMELLVYYCKKYSYKVPLSLKYRYNKAYLNILMNNDGFSIKPSYPPFALPFFNPYTISKGIQRIIYTSVEATIIRFADSVSLRVDSLKRKWQNRHVCELHWDDEKKKVVEG